MSPTFFGGIGQSEALDAAQGAREAILQAQDQLGGRIPAAALLHATSDLDHQAALDTILEAWPGVELIGCTSDGEFASRQGYTLEGLLLVALGSDTVEFAAGSVLASPGADHGGAMRAARARVAQEPTLGLVLTDGLTLNGEEALRGFDAAFERRVPLFGGTAADGWRFTGTRQFHGRQVLADAAVFLLLCGPCRFASAVGDGWTPIGRFGIVTRAAGKVVHEIDGRPALDFYRELMGNRATPSVETPTAVYDGEGRYRYLRASYGGTDTGTGAITFFSSIPEGSRVRLTLVNRDAIIGGAEASLEAALRAFGGGTPDLALCCSCASRRLLLGTRTPDEHDAARRILGEDVPVAGFYGFGEFSASPEGTQFNNESFVTLLLGGTEEP